MRAPVWISNGQKHPYQSTSHHDWMKQMPLQYNIGHSKDLQSTEVEKPWLIRRFIPMRKNA